MKLDKILEVYDTPSPNWRPQFTELTPANKQTVNNRRKSPTHTMIGQGANAYVGTEDVDNFGDVTRISNAADPAHIYLLAIAESLPTYLRNNPYLPIIRKVHQTQRRIDITLERLIPFDTPSIIENESFIERVWNKCLTIPFDGPHPIPTRRSQPIANTFALFLHESAADGDTTHIKDPRLQQVLLWIHSLHTSNWRTTVDIHRHNLMWRPNKYGFQLVITDPLC